MFREHGVSKNTQDKNTTKDFIIVITSDKNPPAIRESAIIPPSQKTTILIAFTRIWILPIIFNCI